MKANKGFTLAEVMIVLSVIGVLTAILLPAAFQATPDENIMKLKKGYNTLATVIQELVSSDRYYADGDLGLKTDGSFVNSKTYLCKTMSDILNTKKVNCSESTAITTQDEQYIEVGKKGTSTFKTIEEAKAKFDEACKKTAPTIKAEIITSDNISYFQTAPHIHFGTTKSVGSPAATVRLFSGEYYTDDDGFDRVYKIFCIDVDGIPTNATKTDCKNECPFGLGVRSDGKILTGQRIDEWIEKNIQQQ